MGQNLALEYWFKAGKRKVAKGAELGKSPFYLKIALIYQTVWEGGNPGETTFCLGEYDLKRFELKKGPIQFFTEHTKFE